MMNCSSMLGRAFGKTKAVVITNFSEKRVEWVVPSGIVSILTRGQYLIGNHDERQNTRYEGDVLTVNPFEVFCCASGPGQSYDLRKLVIVAVLPERRSALSSSHWESNSLPMQLTTSGRWT